MFPQISILGYFTCSTLKGFPNPVRSTDRIGDTIYQDKCASCHGVRREGYYENELVGDQGYPSLVGITASREIIGTQWFRRAHDGMTSVKPISDEEIETINKYLSAADHFSDDRRSLQVSYVWQLILTAKGILVRSLHGG